MFLQYFPKKSVIGLAIFIVQKIESCDRLSKQELCSAKIISYVGRRFNLPCECNYLMPNTIYFFPVFETLFLWRLFCKFTCRVEPVHNFFFLIFALFEPYAFYIAISYITKEMYFSPFTFFPFW